MFRIHWPLYVVKRVVLGVIVFAVLLTGTLVGLRWSSVETKRCGDEEHVWKHGPREECVGVTSGSFSFNDKTLKEVTDLIKKENDEIADKKQSFVSVAYLTTFTLNKDDSNSRESVRRELEGAYLAQKWRNNKERGEKTKIKLLVANLGSNSHQWNYATEKLIKLKNKEKLAAVAGMGPSTPEAEKAIRKLSRNGIPSVASTITASDIKDIDYFVRVAPSNEDEAEAAARYLRQEKEKDKVVVVQDKNKDNRYASTLAKAFKRQYEHKDAPHRPEGPLTFNTRHGGGSTSEFSSLVGNLCDMSPDTIYFAGRGRHLTRFLQALAERSETCRERPFTVFTGDDTTNLTAATLRPVLSADIDVLYTGLAHPDMWDDTPGVNENLSKEFKEEGFLDKKFPHDPRDDGQAMMGHDAVATVSKAIDLITSQGDEVSSLEVGRQFDQIRGDSKQVPAASGHITFDAHGLPVDKSVPILRMQRDGTSKFEALWDKGKLKLNDD